MVFNPYSSGGLDGDVQLGGSAGARVGRRRPSVGGDFAVNVAGDTVLSEGAMRLASSPDFTKALAGFMRSPGGRIGGTLLAGVPIALAAAGELSKDPTNPGGNLAGAAGAVGLGAVGAAAGGALGGTLLPVVGAPIGAALGGWIGSKLGAGGARGGFDFVNGIVNDPDQREIGLNVKRGQAAADVEAYKIDRLLPSLMAQSRAQNAALAEQARIANNSYASNAFSQALFGAVANPRVGVYQDPSFSSALASIPGSGMFMS